MQEQAAENPAQEGEPARSSSKADDAAPEPAESEALNAEKVSNAAEARISMY